MVPEKIANNVICFDTKHFILKQYIIEMLKHFRNAKPYMRLLPLREQLVENNKLIEYYFNVKYPYGNARKRFNSIKQLKEVKRALIIMDIERQQH